MIDVSQRRCKFIDQVNSVLGWFCKLDCDTRTRLSHIVQTFMVVNYGTCLMYQCSHCVRHGV